MGCRKIPCLVRNIVLRIVALGTPPTSKNAWLTSEILSMFHYHVLPFMFSHEKSKMLEQLFSNLSSHVLNTVLAFDKKMTEMNEASLQLSLRQLISVSDVGV